jgi:hypothetical protein
VRAADLYHDEVTTATHEELLRVGDWFNRFVGYHPVVVGGWAVFHYNPRGLGSRDIDLIFPDRAMKDRLVNQYLLTSGYQRERRSAFEEEYALVRKTSRGAEHIYLDVATTSDRNVVHGGRTELPWSLVFKYQIPARFGDAEFYVPGPEVLLLLKVKAALDREHDAKRAYDPYYLQQKAWKDYYDIASLLKTCELDRKLIARLLKAHRFASHFQRAMSSLSRKRSVMARHGVAWSELKPKCSGLG